MHTAKEFWLACITSSRAVGYRKQGLSPMGVGRAPDMLTNYSKTLILILLV